MALTGVGFSGAALWKLRAVESSGFNGAVNALAVFDSGHFEYDSALALIHIGDAQRLFRRFPQAEGNVHFVGGFAAHVAAARPPRA